MVFENFDRNKYNDANPIETFEFDNDNLAQLEGYFVTIGDFENNIMLYRKQMPINLFKQGKIYLIKGHNTQFEEINKEFLRIDAKVDILSIDDTIIINNVSILERHYEFRDIIENEAESSIENIRNLDILENIEVFKNECPILLLQENYQKFQPHLLFSIYRLHI